MLSSLVHNASGPRGPLEKVSASSMQKLSSLVHSARDPKGTPGKLQVGRNCASFLTKYKDFHVAHLVRMSSAFA